MGAHSKCKWWAARSLRVLGLAAELVIEPRRQAEDRRHAIDPEPDEENHLPVPELVIFGDDIELVDIERGKPSRRGRTALEGLEIGAREIVVFSVHLLDRGKDLAF